MWRGRMRKFIPLLCLWSVYCCFAAGGPATLGAEGPLQGNVHFFLLPLNCFFCAGRLSLADRFSVPPGSCRILPSLMRSLLLISLAVPLFLPASDQGIPSRESRGRRLACALARSLSPYPPRFRWLGTLICAVQSAQMAAYSSSSLSSLIFEPGDL